MQDRTGKREPLRPRCYLREVFGSSRSARGMRGSRARRGLGQPCRGEAKYASERWCVEGSRSHCRPLGYWLAAVS